MAIVYRADKGAPLTASELDGNFHDLAQRLLAIETSPLQAEGIGCVQVEDDQMTLTGTKGTVFGPFALPKAFFRPRGAWKKETAYAAYDLVSAGTKLYICQVPHTSQTFREDRLHWGLLFDWGKSIKHEASGELQPQRPLNRLCLYEKATLPETQNLGELGVLIDDKDGVSVVYSNGKTWLRLEGKNAV